MASGYTSLSPERAYMADMYDRVKRPSHDHSLAEAIRFHSQACGLVAYVFNVHPDRVAEAVRDRNQVVADEGVFV